MNLFKQIHFIFLTFSAITVITSCSGSRSTTYLILDSISAPEAISELTPISGSVEATNFTSVGGYHLNLNSLQSANITNTSGKVSSWISTAVGSQNFQQATANLRPDFISVFGADYINFKPTHALNANGVLPAQNQPKLSLFLVLGSNTNGLYFRYGSADSAQSAILEITNGLATIRHRSSTGNEAYRTYNYTTTASAVVSAVYGDDVKDIEFYVNGLRQVYIDSIVVGTPSAYISIPNNVNISNSFPSGVNSFTLAQAVGIGAKLSPRSVYSVSKFIGTDWGITFPDIINYEIKDNTTPAIEPDQLDFNYVATAVLTNKCFVCHKNNSGIPNGGLVFDTYNALINATYAGQPLVLPSNSGASLMYNSVFSNRMPANSPLTASEKKIIKDWIDSGALQ